VNTPAVVIIPTAGNAGRFSIFEKWERLIRSIRWDRLEDGVIFGEQRLLRCSYQQYYDKVHTHISLKKDAPNPSDPSNRIRKTRSTLSESNTRA
jgi:hypothetical protein